MAGRGWGYSSTMGSQITLVHSSDIHIDEDRGAGTLFAGSQAEGAQGSVTLVKQPGEAHRRA